MAILRGIFRRGTILENNIAQTIASTGESLAAGAIFTIPALVLVGAWSEFEFWPTTLIVMFGGLLGIVFMVPLRRALIVERQGRAERIVTDEEIAMAIHTPPHDTRAFFRGECLRRYGSAVFGVNWDSISFGVEDEPIKRILMAEPLKGTREHVNELLENSPTAVELVKNLRA